MGIFRQSGKPFEEVPAKPVAVKYPRLLAEDAWYRVVETAKDTFVIERALRHKDSFGNSTETWIAHVTTGVDGKPYDRGADAAVVSFLLRQIRERADGSLGEKMCLHRHIGGGIMDTQHNNLWGGSNVQD